MFQFQTGSIKRLYDGLATGLWQVKFQFQTGAIKSFEKIAYNITVSCFNSKLVRLKVLMMRLMRFTIYVSIPNWFD